MSLFSRGQWWKRNKGRGRRPNDFWGNKRLHFSIHFDDDSKEFNKLLQTGFLNLAGQGDFQPRPPPEIPPIQPHLIISGIPIPPHVSLPPEIPGPMMVGMKLLILLIIKLKDGLQLHFHYLHLLQRNLPSIFHQKLLIPTLLKPLKKLKYQIQEPDPSKGK
jgi:hypothetical protein